MSESTQERHDREIRELQKALNAIERREEIKRIIKDQDKSLPPYVFEIFKYSLAIILLLIAKDKALEYQWISDLIGG
jgi:hypothetical protein